MLHNLYREYNSLSSVNQRKPNGKILWNSIQRTIGRMQAFEFVLGLKPSIEFTPAKFKPGFEELPYTNVIPSRNRKSNSSGDPREEVRKFDDFSPRMGNSDL